MIEAEERVFAELADSTRRKLLINIAESSPKTATQLAHEFPITRQGIVKHLDLLAEAGLVRSQHLGRETRYSFTPEPLANVNEWVERVGALWDARLLRLKAFIESDQDVNDSKGDEP